MSTVTMPVSASARPASRIAQLATAIADFVTACREVRADVRAMQVAAQRRYPFVSL
jgi:type IV secretory pathway TrbF-like protein